MRYRIEEKTSPVQYVEEVVIVREMLHRIIQMASLEEIITIFKRLEIDRKPDGSKKFTGEIEFDSKVPPKGYEPPKFIDYALKRIFIGPGGMRHK